MYFMQIASCINAMHLWVMVLMIPSMVIILYLYMTAQPKRVRQRKVGLENLKTWDNLKKIQKVENKGNSFFSLPKCKVVFVR